MPPRRNSPYWYHFVEQDEGKKAKCTYCSKVLSIACGSLGNLGRHMKTHHPGTPINRAEVLPLTDISANAEELADDPRPCTSQNVNFQLIRPVTQSVTTVASVSCTSKARQLSIGNFMQSTKPVPISQSKKLDEQLVKMVVKEYQPFSIVEGQEFRKFVCLLNPGYSLPSRKTISTILIPQMYNTTLERVQVKLEDVMAVCLTTDSWTSINNESFTAITAHFINPEHELSNVLLGCFTLEERHTADNLAKLLANEVNHWGLGNKIVTVVSDNAANITAAIRQCNWRNLPCFAHTTNLVVQTALKDIQKVLTKVKSIVEYFKRSSVATANLRAVQVQMSLPELKLKQDVLTRWNSTYDMLDRIFRCREAVEYTLTKLKTRDLILSDDEWKIVEKSVEVLEIFEEVTTEISTENNVSASKVILLAKQMKRKMEHFSLDKSLPPEVAAMIATLKTEVEKRFKDVEDNEILSQAAILDPRFKKQAFKEIKKYDAALTALRTKLSNMTPKSGNNITPPTYPAEPRSKPTSILWKEFDEEVRLLTAADNPTAAGIVELDKYLNEPLLSRSEDPLRWWRERRSVYPRLYELVLRRLCVVATSVPCERIFSKGGLLITERRNRLKSSKASQVLFLNHNL